MRRALLLAAALAVLAGSAAAVTPDEQLKDPALEARARAVSRELRCVICQNQSIDESDADLAHDLRVLLRERIAAGDTDAQAKAYLADRYGSFVLLRPPMKGDTTRTLPFGMPSVVARSLAAQSIIWFDVQSVSWSPFQAAVDACGSIIACASSGVV